VTGAFSRVSLIARPRANRDNPDISVWSQPDERA
jgi:hypothetical protein